MHERKHSFLWEVVPKVHSSLLQMCKETLCKIHLTIDHHILTSGQWPAIKDIMLGTAMHTFTNSKYLLLANAYTAPNFFVPPGLVLDLSELLSFQQFNSTRSGVFGYISQSWPGGCLLRPPRRPVSTLPIHGPGQPASLLSHPPSWKTLLREGCS